MPRGESIPRPLSGLGLGAAVMVASCMRGVMMRCQGFFRGEVWRSFRAPERSGKGGVTPVLEGG